AHKVSGMDSVPRLPIDAGHEVFKTINGVRLAGDLEIAAASGGRGAELDIAAQSITVLSERPKRGVALRAAELSQLGGESLLLGGVRTDASGNETINVVATSIDIKNNAQAPLEAPEVILVAHGGLGGNDLPITLEAGSVIRAVGTPSDQPDSITIGSKSL